jgi:hypothetical protein
MNHNLNIALVIFFSLVLVGMVGWPFIKHWYHSRLKNPFEVTLNGRTYLIDQKSGEWIVEQMARQDKVFDELEAKKNEIKTSE